MENNTKYRVKFTESQKAVTCEILVETDSEDVLKDAKELFEQAQEYSKLKTLQKNL
jgi:hypothetical protein